ncbi:SDR family oxidoreductase [Cytophagaceae bacterium DM2B3-1]|uniref:SDR family oxidoreductase n=1 Tax=Xanthocytophaga flava TaxID=3048013 RepID=A0ABT7CFW5_9BACT|nr:SDR family oxidoreductase [Xanthocytophaga flavus]MDJ1472705.1 SDR family oxidoreductase [Xanthocytophaga flavus]MDJ1491885.1 SDR family oxidoreductase [Xanthocytophaga flavus]
MYETPFHTHDLSSYNFLITGGAGFIGSNLVEYLLKYSAGKVRVLDNLSTGYRANLDAFMSYPNFEFIEGDIRNLETCQIACQNMDVVLHQAALGSVPRSVNDPITTNTVNIDGFLNMLVAARDTKIKRFVYAASSSTYGDSKKLPKVEDEIGRPLSPYAVTKYVNELYADVFGKTYGMQIIGLRYFNVFGPRQSPQGAYAAVIPLMIDALRNGISPKIFGDGEQTRDFTFVANAVQANIKAAFASEDAVNQVYNIAVGERTSLNQLFSVLKDQINPAIVAGHAPNRAGDIRDSLADISKATRLLGYDPQVRFEQGLKITVEWFRDNYIA